MVRYLADAQSGHGRIVDKETSRWQGELHLKRYIRVSHKC